MMEIIETGDEYLEPRFSNGSMSCLFPTVIRIDSPRRSLSYNKIPQEPLKLTVHKLDGSSFGIKVSKTGTVGELKRAVEAAFSYLPKKGPGRVSWEHVWGQFCLCHEGNKLLSDSDYIRMFGIKDGDQLQFIHHASNTYNSIKTQRAGDDSDSDDEPSISHGYGDEKQDHDQRIEILVDNQDDNVESENDVVSRCEYRLSHILRRWFQYSKLHSSEIMRYEERGNNSLNFSDDVLGFLKNIFGVSSNKYDSRRRAYKVK